MTFYLFHDLIEPAATGDTVITAFGQLWDATAIITGTTCWGHDTGVAEANTRDFSEWTGTGTVSGTGDSEVIQLTSGQYMESPVVYTGPTTVTYEVDKYGDGAGAVVVKYRSAATSGGVSGESWSTYSAPFVSAGYAQARIERA